MAKSGRKSKLTPELQKQLCDILSTGNYIEAACDYIGISKSQYYRWCEANEEFRNAVARSRAASELQSVARIKKAAQGGQTTETQIIEKYNKDGNLIEKKQITTLTPPQWQADAWFLERSFPDRWGKTRQDINVNFNKMDNDGLIDFITGKADSTS